MEKEIDGYLLDVGYSPTELTALSQSRFDFFLYEKATNTPKYFSDVWVRIEKDGALLFAGDLGKPKFGRTGMSYNFPEAGTYDIFTRFNNGTSTIVEGSFEIDVLPGEKNLANFDMLFGFWWLFALGFACGIVPLLVINYQKIFNYFGSFLSIVNLGQSGTLIATNPIFKNSSMRFWLNVVINLATALVFAILGYYVTGLVIDYLNKDESAPPAIETTTSGTKIVLTANGFEPAELSVKKGTTVTFSTTAGRPFWPASNLHPSHEIYSEFDPKKPLKPDETWQFTFNKIGDWNMHDHIRSYYTGTIHVLEN